MEILVVDDASTDGSLDVIRSRPPLDSRLKIVNLPGTAPRGASASRNAGIRASTGKWLVVLDNDTEVTENWLSALLSPFERDGSIGAVQSMLIDDSDRKRVAAYGEALIPCLGFPYIMDNRPARGEIVPITVSLAIRREVVEKIGLFDEKMHIEIEDFDYGYRVWLAGYKAVCAFDSIVYHVEGKQISRRSARFRRYETHKNTFRFILKNYSLQSIILYMSTILLGRLFVSLYRLLKGNPDDLVGLVDAIRWNLIQLPDSLQERYRIQRLRLVTDGFIFERIGVPFSFRLLLPRLRA
jgi:hypothetical protein